MEKEGRALRKGRGSNGEVLCIWMSSVLTTRSMLALSLSNSSVICSSFTMDCYIVELESLCLSEYTCRNA